jgi:hypothetical protein
MVHMKRVTPAELEAAGTVSEMVAKLRSGTQEVKEHMARIIQALTTQAPASTPELVQAGVIGPLVKLLKEGNEQGQGFAAAAIASIAAFRAGGEADVRDLVQQHRRAAAHAHR